MISLIPRRGGFLLGLESAVIEGPGLVVVNGSRFSTPAVSCPGDPRTDCLLHKRIQAFQLAHEVAKNRAGEERTHLRETSAYNTKRGLHHGPVDKGGLKIGDVDTGSIQHCCELAEVSSAANRWRAYRQRLCKR